MKPFALNDAVRPLLLNAFVASPLLAAILLVHGSAAAASHVPRPGVAKEAEILSVQGEGTVRFVEGGDWIGAFRQQVLTGGDRLRTGSHGRMGILFSDGVQIKVNRNSSLSIRPSGGTGKGAAIGVEIGEVWSRARAVPGGLRIETPSATAAVRGTEWDLQVDENGTTRVAVIRGAIEFYNDFGRVTVAPGEQATAAVGHAPVKTTLVRPKDRVQWVVSYTVSVPDLVRFRSLRREEAVRALSGAEERYRKDPRDRDNRIVLAELLYDLRQRSDSLKLADELLSADPGNRRARVLRGFAELDAGRVEDARKDFGIVLEEAGGAERRNAGIGLAGVHLAENETGKAEALLARLREEGGTADTDLVSAAFEAYLGDFRAALRSCADGAARHPGDERFRLLAANLSLLVDERDKAREHVAAALALSPASADAHAVLGSCEYLEGRGKAAEAAYRKALELDPGNSGAMNGLGLVLMDTGRYDEAEAVLSRGVEAAPRGSMTMANRGILYSLVEELGKARADFAGALAADPSNVAALNGRGWVALKEGRTDEAVRSFLEASLLEPRHSQSRSFLAIAYYQQGQIGRALEETRLAEELDPKDPFPHLVAYVIYQDTYRTSDAVREAGRVLELIPNLKSIDEVANTRSGLSNLGSALSTLGLSNWAESYAQESFDPHVASSHFFASRQYNSNSLVTVSELTQGLLLDPLAVSSPTRYQDIVRRPRTDVSLSTTQGRIQGDGTGSYSAVAQGYTRKLFEQSWSLSASGYRNEGYVENGDSKSIGINGAYGAKPDAKNGFYVSGYYTRDESGYYLSETDPDPDDRLKSTYWSAEAGYHHRFGPKNELMARVAGGRTDYRLTNPSAFGNGLTGIQLSMIAAGWTVAETRDFFRQGMYDLSAYYPGYGTTLATDSTGTFAADGTIPRLSPAFPANVDFDTVGYSRTTSDTLGVQLRHLFRLSDAHEVTYGLEFIPFRDRVRTGYNDIDATGDSIYFWEDYFNTTAPWLFAEYSAASVSTDTENDGHFLFGYLDDRWTVAPGILVNGGAFVFRYKDDNGNDTARVCPKIGLAANLGKDHVLRTGYQRWVEMPSLGTLAPMTNAGLVINNSLAIDGSRIEDYQARIESRWTKRLFTVFGVERILLDDPAPEAGNVWRSVRVNLFDAAANAILSGQFGAYLKYRRVEAEGDDGPLKGRKVPGVPEETTTGGIVWVSPWYVKATLAVSYCTESYEDYTNTEMIPSHVQSSLAVNWEPFRKHLLLGMALSNLLNDEPPTPPRAFSATVEYRF
jgi:tetratricopeptide (TPR) repeat protein